MIDLQEYQSESWTVASDYAVLERVFSLDEVPTQDGSHTAAQQAAEQGVPVRRRLNVVTSSASQ